MYGTINIEENYPKWENREITVVKFIEILELKKNSFYTVIGVPTHRYQASSF